MKWLRHLYQPCKGLGVGGAMVSGSREHIELSRQAAGEGIVLLKNENQVLPLAPEKRQMATTAVSENSAHFFSCPALRAGSLVMPGSLPIAVWAARSEA